MGTIHQEIRQTRPFADPAEEAIVTLVATADRVRDRLNRVTTTQGLTVQQYNVLRILRGAGQQGLPTLDIASRMIERSPGITRLLDRLEAHRLVRRERCPEDRRQVLCRATPRALRLLDALEQPMREGARECLSALDATSIPQLVALLDQVRAAARPPEPPSPTDSDC